MKKLNTTDELEYLKLLAATPEYTSLLTTLKDTFNIIYARSQVVLSLTTICLTITGFSGPRIAAASQYAKFFIIFGLSFVLLSTLVLFMGPLHIQWITRYKAETIEETLVKLIRRRNIRTIKYRVAIMFLGIGLTGYVIALIAFLFQL